MSERVRLGDWTCPSGNNVVAYYVPGTMPSVVAAWDSPPPLSPADHAHYHAVILPELVVRISQYTETLGRALVITR